MRRWRKRTNTRFSPFWQMVKRMVEHSPVFPCTPFNYRDRIIGRDESIDKNLWICRLLKQSHVGQPYFGISRLLHLEASSKVWIDFCLPFWNLTDWDCHNSFNECRVQLLHLRIIKSRHQWRTEWTDQGRSSGQCVLRSFIPSFFLASNLACKFCDLDQSWYCYYSDSHKLKVRR